MAVLHDFKCLTCDRIFDDVAEVCDTPDTPTGTTVVAPPCPTCGGVTQREFLPPAVSWNVDAVVVYRAPDGSFRFPGENHGSSTAKYDAMGYERVEARGFGEVRQLETRMNRHEQSQLARANERRLAHIEQVEGYRRSITRDGMNQGFYIPAAQLRADGQVIHTGRRTFVKLSERTKDQLRATMSRNDAKGHRRGGEPGLHVNVYSDSRSNREESRRSDGKRHRD